jgi:DNA-binding MarR family transcriptional regulator
MNKNTAAPDQTVFALIGAAHALEAKLETALAEVGLSVAKYGVLDQLAIAGEPLSLSQLAARLSCVRSNMTQLIDRLEADGLVRRVDDPNDRRSVLAALTPLGGERQSAGEACMARVHAQFNDTFTAADRAALTRLLGRIV